MELNFFRWRGKYLAPEERVHVQDITSLEANSGVLAEMKPENLADLRFWLKSDQPDLERLKIRFFKNSRCQVVGFYDQRSSPFTAYFGYWSGDESGFEEMHRWFRTLGVRRLLGPVDYSTFGRYRLRLNAFAETPFLNEPANSLQELQQLKNLGYRLDERYVSYVFKDLDLLRSWAKKNALQAGDISSLRSLANMNELEWMNRLPQMHQLIDQVFSENPLFRPISWRCFSQMYGERLFAAAEKSYSVLGFDADDRVKSFCICFREALHPQRLLVKTLGVGSRHRGWGKDFFELVHWLLLPHGDFTEVVICQMKDGNVPSLLLRNRATERREYGLFFKTL